MTVRLLLRRPWNPERRSKQLPRSLYRYVVSFAPGHQATVCVLSLAVAGLAFVPLELQRRIVNTALEAEDLNLLVWLCGFYAAYMLANAVLKITNNSWRDWIGQSAVYQLRRRLIGRLEESTEDSNDVGDGRAVAVVDKEVDLVGLFVGAALSEPITHLGIIACMLIYMLVVEPVIVLVSICFLIPQVLLVPVFQHRLNMLLERRISLLRTLGDDVAGTESEADKKWRKDADLSDILPGALPAGSMLPDKEGEIGGGRRTSMTESLLVAIFRNRMLFLFIKYVLKAVLNLLSQSALLSVLAVGGYLVIVGQTSIGVVVAFLTGFERLGEPVRDMVLFYREMEQSRVQYGLLRNWPEAEHTPQSDQQDAAE